MDRNNSSWLTAACSNSLACKKDVNRFDNLDSLVLFQVLMQLAERGTIFGPVDFFRVRGKFAMTDAYEDHFNLPKSRTLIITHRLVILLQVSCFISSYEVLI